MDPVQAGRALARKLGPEKTQAVRDALDQWLKDWARDRKTEQAARVPERLDKLLVQSDPSDRFRKIHPLPSQNPKGRRYGNCPGVMRRTGRGIREGKIQPLPLPEIAGDCSVGFFRVGFDGSFGEDAGSDI